MRPFIFDGIVHIDFDNSLQEATLTKVPPF